MTEIIRNSNVSEDNIRDTAASIIEPARRVNADLVEKIVTLQAGDSQYPFARPFEDYYKALIAPEHLSNKYAIAYGLVGDGRFDNLQFLAREFIPAGIEVPPEAHGYKESLELLVRNALIERGDKQALKDVERDLRKFVSSIGEGKSLDAQKFRKLTGLFSASSAVDILYRSRPEFRGIPVERVKGILADYLGETLMTRTTFNSNDIEIGIEYLSDPNFQEALVGVIKESCLSFYHFTRKTGSNQTDRENINEYFEILDLETQQFDSQLVRDVITRVRNYYNSLFEIAKPASIVHALKEERAFPDINQLINIKEIADKKRMLIADEMGLGKSASAILAKEILGVKQALVVVPSNVISTWTKYLSDREEGYFKKGHAPRVLVVENPESLKQVDISSYSYVIISHERLNDGYTDELLNLNYGMLIVDEVHKLKNLREGIRASSLLRLAGKIEGDDSYLALLSGTPVPNKIKDLAMLLKLLYLERFIEVDDKELIRSIIWGDIIDLRSLLLPRMQRKYLAESIAMPELREKILEVQLSTFESEIYEVLIENDELEAKDKMRILRQFLLNPNALDSTPGIPSSKVAILETSLKEAFQKKHKVVMFVNGYVEGIIRGDKTIFDMLTLPEGVELRIIEGDITQQQREAIQKELNESNKKIFLVVSGQTADVGVDFSAAQAIYFYNEPWTEYDKRQQLHRVYREGLKGDLESVTFITKDTIEEGIHRYIQIKMEAIEKLLRGIPISDLEREMIEKSEDQPEEDLEINAELAKYYFSAWDRMMNIFRHIKEIGEEDFKKFLTDFGREYAECYTDLGSRSYYANANRVVGTLLDTFVKEKRQDAEEIKILDIASGPEILKKHIPEQYQNRIVSLDINRHHFEGAKAGKRVVGSFLGLPFQEKSFDYANLALAWHYTSFIPSKGNYERLEVLVQANRILKDGGRLIISNIYSRELKDEEKFRELMQTLGFKVVEHYTGAIAVDTGFKSHVYTLQKERDIDTSLDIIIESLNKDTIDSLKFKKLSSRLKDSRKIITEFSINGTFLGVRFNKEDLEILEEERAVVDLAELLKARYGEIKDIPKEEILNNNFGRIRIKKKYVLFKKLEKGPGVVVVN